ncbi:MAG: hypothetical protein ABI591_30745 [Kofleriaceae bacterium]
MRLASSVVIAGMLIVGCGSKSPAGGDDDGTSDGGGSNTGDGGGNGQTPTTITVTMKHRPANAAMYSFVVAYQDGAGPWTVAPAPSGDVYSLPIYSPVYAVAWTCVGNAGQLRQVSELQFAVSERTSLFVDVPARCTDALPTVALHGTITNAAILTNYVVKFGDRSAAVTQQDTFTLQTPVGTHDLVLLAAGSINAGTDAIASSALVVRNVTVSAAMDLTIDATNTEAVQSFSVDNLMGGTRDTATTLLYANGTTAQLVTDATPFYETESLAADQMVGSDIYDQQMTVASTAASTMSSVATATPGDLTWTEVPAIGAVTGTAITTPYPRVTSTWAKYAGAVGYTWGATQLATGGSVVWTAQLSPAVVGDAGSYTMPDLSGVTGWNTALQMVAGKAVGGGVQAMTSTGAGDFPPLVPPAVGTLRTTATGLFAVTP